MSQKRKDSLDGLSEAIAKMWLLQQQTLVITVLFEIAMKQLNSILYDILPFYN